MTCTIEHPTRSAAALPLSAFSPAGRVNTFSTVGYSHPDHGFMCGGCLRDHGLFAGSDGVIDLQAWMVVKLDGNHVKCAHCGASFTEWLD